MEQSNLLNLIFFPLLLLLPCPFCLPAASLRVAAAVTQSVQEEADQGATWGWGLAVPLHPGDRSPRCSLFSLSRGFQADQSPDELLLTIPA